MRSVRSIAKLLSLTIILMTLAACVHTRPSEKHAEIHDIVARANSDFYLDQRIWFQNVQADIQSQTIILRGEAFFKRPVQGLIKKIRKAGWDFPVLDSINYLPEQFEDGSLYRGVLRLLAPLSRKARELWHP